jgi:hypothetical protein
MFLPSIAAQASYDHYGADWGRSFDDTEQLGQGGQSGRTRCLCMDNKVHCNPESWEKHYLTTELFRLRPSIVQLPFLYQQTG